MKRTFFITLFLFAGFQPLIAQVGGGTPVRTNPPPPPPPPLEIVPAPEPFDQTVVPAPRKAFAVENPQVPAEFPGGEEALKKWLNDHVEYPAQAREHQAEGIVKVMCLIGKDGTPSEVSILHSDNVYLNQPTRDLILNKMPKWIPAKNVGEFVASNVEFEVVYVFR